MVWLILVSQAKKTGAGTVPCAAVVLNLVVVIVSLLAATSMKSPVGATLLSLLVVALLGAAAAHLAYRSGQPRPFSPDEERAYRDKQTPFLDDQDAPDQSQALQVWEKRGFGSMMPAYLLQLYRPDQPLINPSLLFRSSQGRGRGAYTGQG
ncbi:uncharacterized protein LOC135101808 [Scylla paramamosain]|uniref:uncharacterized protein LOC135101808 n=1 Tax=Scylla paramamosain TaxID=85552 RepID=UPI00308347C7